jgi:hypothetical protein
VKSIPIYDATAPIACTAGPDELPKRIEQIERLRTELAGVERTEHGLVLRFPDRPDLEADVRGFTRDENGCCQFWGFAVEHCTGELALRWDGPPETRALMDQLADYFEGKVSMDAILELL